MLTFSVWELGYRRVQISTSLEEVGFRITKDISDTLSFAYRFLFVLMQELENHFSNKKLPQSENQRLHEIIYLLNLRDKDCKYDTLLSGHSQ